MEEFIHLDPLAPCMARRGRLGGAGQQRVSSPAEAGRAAPFQRPDLARPCTPRTGNKRSEVSGTGIGTGKGKGRRTSDSGVVPAGVGPAGVGPQGVVPCDIAAISAGREKRPLVT